MLYQALIGAWEGHADAAFADRMAAYAIKAAREGKEETSWTNPNETYEQALQDFVRRLLDPAVSSGFLTSFAAFAERTALLGALNGLSQLALKALLPGVPDFYQGTERWDFSLVDPDNRRPVDFCARAQELAAPERPLPELARNWRDGRIKQALTQRFLALRRQFADLFQHGAYVPLDVSGEHAEHVVAFARAGRRKELVIIVGRHFATVTAGGTHWPSGWRGAVSLPPKTHYADALNGKRRNFRQKRGTFDALFGNIIGHSASRLSRRDFTPFISFM